MIQRRKPLARSTKPIKRSAIKRSSKSRKKDPTPAQRARWELVRALGCRVDGCRLNEVEIHHCFTGGGGRRNHDLVIALCHTHHRGELGIHKTAGQYGLGRKEWQERWGSEQWHIEETQKALDAHFVY